MFLSEKFRMFRTRSAKENSLVSKRSEFRLKSFASSLDVRTWSFDSEDRRRAFLDSVNSPGIHFGNYIPFNELLRILGIKKAFVLREPDVCKGGESILSFDDRGESIFSFDDRRPSVPHYGLKFGKPGSAPDLQCPPSKNDEKYGDKTKDVVFQRDSQRENKDVTVICKIKKDTSEDSEDESCKVKYDNKIKFCASNKVSSTFCRNNQGVVIGSIKHSQTKITQPSNMEGTLKCSDTTMIAASTFIVPNNSLISAGLTKETVACRDDQEIKVQAIIESYYKMKLHLEKLIPVAVEKENMEGELVKMSETIKDLSKVISYQDNEINRLINILQCNHEMLFRQDRNKTTSNFCQTVPEENDQMCVHMISVNSHDNKNQQLYFYQLQISLNQERKNFNKLLKLLRIEQETRKNIQEELNRQLRRATQLAVERDLLRKTLQYNEKTVQRYMLESETEKEKAKLLEHSLSMLEQQLERIEHSLQTDIENCKTLQSQQIVDRIQKHIKDSKKLNRKLLGRNRLETCCVPSKSDTELYKPCNRVSKILFTDIRTLCCDDQDEDIKPCLDRIHKSRDLQHSYKERKATIKSSHSLCKSVSYSHTSIVFEKNIPESGRKLRETGSSKFRAQRKKSKTVAPEVGELYKELKRKPQQPAAQDFGEEKFMSKVSFGKTRSRDKYSPGSEISVLHLKRSKSSTRGRKSALFRDKNSAKMIPRKKSDTRQRPHVDTFHPKNLQLPDDKKKAERRRADTPETSSGWWSGLCERPKTPRSSRSQVGERRLIHKFYPEDWKPTAKTPKKSASAVSMFPLHNVDMKERLVKTRTRLQEIYTKYSDYRNQFEKSSKTFILDKYSSTQSLPSQHSRHECTVDSYVDLSKNYKNKCYTGQSQFTTPGVTQSSYRQTCVTEGPHDAGGTRTKYLTVYDDDVTVTPLRSKLVDSKPRLETPTAADKRLVHSSKYSLKSTSYKDNLTNSFYRSLNVDANYRYRDDATSKGKYDGLYTSKQPTSRYLKKDLYKKDVGSGSDYSRTAPQARPFTARQSYLLEKPSYRQIAKYKDSTVTDFQYKYTKPEKFVSTMDENVASEPTEYRKSKPERSSSKKKTKRKIQFENSAAQPYQYDLPNRSVYASQGKKRNENYYLPEKEHTHTFTMDGGKHFCSVCDGNFQAKYNTANLPLSSSKASGGVRKTDTSVMVNDLEQTVMFDQKNSNYYGDMFTRPRETPSQFADRLYKQTLSSYQTGRGQVPIRSDPYKARSVLKQPEPPRPATVNESYYKRMVDPYAQSGATTVTRQAPSAYSTSKHYNSPT